ncbi:MAG: hypothetical protein EOO40_12765, partial [Deltaproteobacteria bacterium]
MQLKVSSTALAVSALALACSVWACGPDQAAGTQRGDAPLQAALASEPSGEPDDPADEDTTSDEDT